MIWNKTEVCKAPHSEKVYNKTIWRAESNALKNERKEFQMTNICRILCRVNIKMKNTDVYSFYLQKKIIYFVDIC